MPTSEPTAPNIRQLAPAICAYLGLGWRILPETEEHEWWVSIANDTGLTLTIRYDDYRKRIHISAAGVTVSTARGPSYYAEARPTISVSPTSSARHIANHIARRLYDAAADYWRAAMNWKTIQLNGDDKHRALIAELASYPDAGLGHDSHTSVYGVGWHASVHTGDNLTLTFSSISARAARTLLDAFHDGVPPEPN